MRRIGWQARLWLGILGSFALVGCSTIGPASPSPQPGGAGSKVAGARRATIQWLGHATFVLTSPAGTRVLTDPFNSSVGYAVPKLEGIDLITVGHEHGDHNNVGMAAGQPTIVRGLEGGDWAKVDRQVKDVHVRAVATYHDEQQGGQRGKNAAFVFEVDGLRIVHLSDLGHTLSPEQVQQLGPADVLMVPVGGSYTIDAAGATKVVEQLGPKVVLPMHYKTAKMSPSWPGTGLEPFLEGKKVERLDSTTLTVDRGSLPAGTTVYVLGYE